MQKPDESQKLENTKKEPELDADLKNFLEKRLPNFVVVKTLKSGESFGELALISNSRRNATVVAARDCHFLLIGKHSYDQVLSKIFRRNGF